MKNKIIDLNDHLMAQLERLGDESLDENGLQHEIQRADAMAKIATQIVGAANTTVKAAALAAEYGHTPYLPLLLPEVKNEGH